MSFEELLTRALERGECVLQRGPSRRVVLLDGRAVVIEGDGGGVTQHFSADEATAAFRAAIEAALAEGFEPAHRDPPKPVAFVQPTRAPSPPRPPVVEHLPPPRRALATNDTWLLEPPALRVTIDPLEGACWDPLFETHPEGVSFLDLEADSTEEALELLGERGLPQWVRGLGLLTWPTVEDYCAAQLDPSSVWSHFTQLEVLELRAGASISVPSPLAGLRQLSLFTSEATPEVLTPLCAGSWPALEALELFLDASTPLRADAVLAALHLERFPKLRHLALRGVEDGATLVDALRPRGLASLEVSHSDVDGGFGARSFALPSGIEVLSERRFYPVRSARFSGR